MLAGTLTMYVGEPPERHDVPTGGLIHIEPGTTLQTANHGADDLVVYAYGSPPDHGAELLESALSGGRLPLGDGATGVECRLRPRRGRRTPRRTH